MSEKKSKKRFQLSRAWQNRLAAALVLASVISGIATYAALTETPPLGNDPHTVIWLLNINFIILLMLVVLITQRIVSLWSGRKRDLAGSHLHVRLVYTFSLLAAAPAIIMTVFSAFFFHFGVQTWFSERVQTAIYESQAVAEAYLDEHKQVIRADILAMANDLNRQAPYILANEKAFENIMQTQSMLRNLSEAIVFDSHGRVLARSGLTFTLEFEDVPQYAMRAADEGEVVITTGGNDDRVRALVRLNNLTGGYLFVGRMVDPNVLSHVTATREASQDYADLQARYAGLQVSVTMIFVVIGILLTLMAVWLGLLLARQLVSPITALIKTADRVRAGDFAARVPDQEKLQEFRYLAQSFNRMTKQIQEQQNELLEANRQLDRRRRFTETVLEGVSSGIVGVDADGVINLVNNSAMKLLVLGEEKLVGEPVSRIVPELETILEQAHAQPQKITQAEIPIQQDGAGKKIFLIRIAIEMIDERDTGAIITFDDITDLQSAQRKAAWADVARRIAHEIKNPLTPIQLSAERLRKKYLAQIKTDPDTFSQCTDTIIKNVNDIGRMVNEFSSFARMPEPVMNQGDLAAHIREATVLHKSAHQSIIFDINIPENEAFETLFDSRQLRQVLNNIIQNAVDSIEIRIEEDEKAGKDEADIIPGKIIISLFTAKDGDIVLSVSDNGGGLPEDESASSLAEPYITHKPKGTGLGLAIVKKIMDDHEGRLFIDPPDALKARLQEDPHMSGERGATISLLFPVKAQGGVEKEPRGKTGKAKRAATKGKTKAKAKAETPEKNENGSKPDSKPGAKNQEKKESAA